MECHGTKMKASTIQVTTNQKEVNYLQKQISINYIITKLGTSQKEDKLIFGGTPEEKHRYIGGSVTEDNKYLLITSKSFNFRKQTYSLKIYQNQTVHW